MQYQLDVPRLGSDILNQTHTIIGGTTGSGKSVLLDQVCYCLFARSPARNAAVLIDPKRVELSRFAAYPHVWRYAETMPQIVQALHDVAELMNRRYQDMKNRGLQQYDGVTVYVIIDELAHIATDSPEALGLLVSLGRLGRAAGIHIIAATQSPDRKTLSAQLQQNFTARAALRCRDRIESRQILGAPGAELLPKIGKCLYYSPDTLQPVPVDVLKVPPAWWARLGAIYGIRTA